MAFRIGWHWRNEPVMPEIHLWPAITLMDFKATDSDIDPVDLSIELLDHFWTGNVIPQD